MTCGISSGVAPSPLVSPSGAPAGLHRVWLERLGLFHEGMPTKGSTKESLFVQWQLADEAPGVLVAPYEAPGAPGVPAGVAPAPGAFGIPARVSPYGTSGISPSLLESPSWAPGSPGALAEAAVHQESLFVQLRPREWGQAARGKIYVLLWL